MERDSYHSERSHCLSDMRRQCVGVLGLEACEAQGPVNTTSPSLICATLEDLCCYNITEWSSEEKMVLDFPITTDDKR